MSYLIDTHALLWFAEDSPKLSSTAKTIIDANEPKFLSTASVWEIAIKVKLGRLKLQRDIDEVVKICQREIDYRLLPIELAHIYPISTLELHHNDPFDRLLISQAKVENLQIISVDTQFDNYPITRVW